MIGSIHRALRHAAGRHGVTRLWHRTVGSIVLLALGGLLAPLVVTAQRPGKVAQVGILSTVNPRSAPFWVAFEQRLQELGYAEGQTLAIEFRTAEGQVERLSALAAELVHLPVDVLVASGPEATLQAAQQATKTIPIVMVAIDYDPIALGYVAGLPRSGGNITGVVNQQLELTGKRLELLKEAIPQMQRVAVLWDASSADQFRAAEAAARELGVQVHSVGSKILQPTISRVPSRQPRGTPTPFWSWPPRASIAPERSSRPSHSSTACRRCSPIGSM